MGNIIHKSAQRQGVQMRALHPYQRKLPDEINFITGDTMLIFERTEGEARWFGKNLRTKQEGYIPYKYLDIDKTLTNLDAWFEIRRPEAEAKLLLSGPLLSGTYIVRPSSHSPNYALSVLLYDQSCIWEVKHYKIIAPDNDIGYYLHSKTQCSFSDIEELLAYYKKETTGMLYPLTVPFSRTLLLHFDEKEKELGKLEKQSEFGEFGQRVRNWILPDLPICNENPYNI